MLDEKTGQFVQIHRRKSAAQSSDQNHNYQFVTIGWIGTRYVHSSAFHLCIADNGKIWIRANETDIDIAEVLEEQGVPKSDIVLGFFPAYMREMSDYATA